MSTDILVLIGFLQTDLNLFRKVNGLTGMRMQDALAHAKANTHLLFAKTFVASHNAVFTQKDVEA